MSELASVLDSLAVDDVHALPDAALVQRGEALLVARNKLDAELARTIQAADVREATVNECGRQTRGWLIEERFMAPKAAGSLLWVSRRLPAHPAIAAALVDGEISLEHVRTLIGCLSALPPEWVEAAHDELLSFACIHDPAMLAELCKELRTRSGVDESAEERTLRQFEGRYLNINTTIDGMVHVEGMVPAAMGSAINPPSMLLSTRT